MTPKIRADLRAPRLRLHDGTVVVPALFSGPKRAFSAMVPADAPDRVQRNGQWYRLAVSQPAPHSYVLYDATPDASRDLEELAMAGLQLHPGSEPLPEGGEALLQRLRTVLDAEYVDRPSAGWCVAIDTCRQAGETVFSVVVWQESAGGQWLGEPFIHPGAPIERIAKHFEEWLAEREAPVPTRS